MKIFQCSAGNKQCGKRCIPNDHRCREDGTSIGEVDTIRGDKKFLRTLAIGGAALAAVGLVVAINQRGKFNSLGEVPPDVMTSAISESRKDSRLPMDQAKALSLFENSARDNSLKDIEVIQGLEGSDLVKPQLSSLMRERGIDPASIAVVTYDGEATSEKGKKIFSSIGTFYQTSEGKHVILVNKATKFSKNADTSNIVGSKDVMGLNEDPLENMKKTLNHELTHIVQGTGWVMDDNVYQAAEMFVLPYYNMGKLQSNLGGELYTHQFESFSKIYQEVSNGGINEQQGLAIARRMEVEAWLLNQTEGVMNGLLNLGTAKS